MKPKHIIISIVYLASIVLLTFPSLIGIFTRGVLLSVIGGIGLLGMSGAYGAYMYSSLSNNKLPELTMDNETEYSKYVSMQKWITNFTDSESISYSNTQYNNPFYKNTQYGKSLREVVENIQIKYDKTIQILSDSFNPSDITYQNYISVLDDVLKLSTKYVKSIKKRLDVFDYREYDSYPNSAQCREYLKEIMDKCEQLDDIGNKFDTLLHELIHLDEISEAPLVDLQKLIEITSEYKTIDG